MNEKEQDALSDDVKAAGQKTLSEEEFSDVARLKGLIELTNHEGENGRWSVTLDYDNYHDGARVLNAIGYVIADCYDLDKTPEEQFRYAIDEAIARILIEHSNAAGEPPVNPKPREEGDATLHIQNQPVSNAAPVVQPDSDAAEQLIQNCVWATEQQNANEREAFTEQFGQDVEEYRLRQQRRYKAWKAGIEFQKDKAASVSLETDVEKIANKMCEALIDTKFLKTAYDIRAELTRAWLPVIREHISTALVPLRRELEEARIKTRSFDSDYDCSHCGSPDHLGFRCPTLRTEEHKALVGQNELIASLQREIAGLRERLSEIKKGAEADEADLQKMRDGTKLTRAGVVEIIVYQQQDIAALQQRFDKTEAALRKILALTPVPSVCDDPNCWPCLMWAIANAALAFTEKQADKEP